MRDSFGRDIDYLRLSITESCNLGCIYCRPVEKPVKGTGLLTGFLSADRCVEIAGAAVRLGITKVRLTGGEPCAHPDLVEIVRGIAAIPEVSEVCLTTNGTLIAPMAAELRAAGLARVNISLDTLDPDRYRIITRGGSLADALAGLAAVKAAGFENTKVNCVLMDGINDDEFEAFEVFAAEQGVEVRFIELMPIGPALDLMSGGTVTGQGVPDGGKVGQQPTCPHCPTIAPISRPFCSTCNRIRVTADEHAKPCLHSAEEIDLHDLHGEDLENALRAAILAKPAGHNLAQGSSQSLRNMLRIGG